LYQEIDPVFQYCELMSGEEDEVLAKLSRETQAKQIYARMISGPLQGRLLQFLSEMQKPKRILEIGTFTGYSAICLARGLSPEGELHTIDNNPEIEDFARKFFQIAGLSDKIQMHIGDAKNIIPSLPEIYDIIFIDADKENYPQYFDICLPKLREGGILIADNVLWGGKVLEADKHKDKETKGVVEFNKMVAKEKSLRKVFLPLRDGLLIAKNETYEKR